MTKGKSHVLWCDQDLSKTLRGNLQANLNNYNSDPLGTITVLFQFLRLIHFGTCSWEISSNTANV